MQPKKIAQKKSCSRRKHIFSQESSSLGTQTTAWPQVQTGSPSQTPSGDEPHRSSAEDSQDSDSEQIDKDKLNFFIQLHAPKEIKFPYDEPDVRLKNFLERLEWPRTRQKKGLDCDVQVGRPENVRCEWTPRCRVGLPPCFDKEPNLAAKSFDRVIPGCPANIKYGTHTTCLGRLNSEFRQAPLSHLTWRGEKIHKTYEGGGRVVPFIDKDYFLKRRMDQDLTAALNDYYKDTPEEEIPDDLPTDLASEILGNYAQKFSTQLERRNLQDKAGEVSAMLPAYRLETNVLASEILRHQNRSFTMLAKRAPELDTNVVDKKEKERLRKQKYRANRAVAKKTGSFI